MGRARRARAGRKRKLDAARTPSGQISRAGQTVIPPEVIAQRARLAPGTPADVLRVEGGTPLSLLRLRGDITTQQMDAGERLGKLWRRWAAAISAPPRAPVNAEAGSPQDLDPEDWRRLSDTMHAAWEAIEHHRQSKLVFSLLESVCVEEVMPPYLMPGRGLREQNLEALRYGLTQMVAFFRIAARAA